MGPARFHQLLLEHASRRFRGAPLLVVEEVDARPVLCADIVALSHPLRRVVVLPEHAKEVFVPNLRGIVHDEDYLVVTGEAGAHLAVRRIRRVPARIADRRRVDTGQRPEFLLGAPEATHAEQRGAVPLRKRWFEAMTVDEMRIRHTHPLGTAGQRLGGSWHAKGLHDVFFSGSNASATPFMQ